MKKKKDFFERQDACHEGNYVRHCREELNSGQNHDGQEGMKSDQIQPGRGQLIRRII